MPCPKVGLKLATASPNGRIPAGKRSSLWYRRHRLVGYLWNATSPMGSPCRMAAAMRGAGLRRPARTFRRNRAAARPWPRRTSSGPRCRPRSRACRARAGSLDAPATTTFSAIRPLVCAAVRGVADADVDAGLGRAVKSPLLQPDRQSGAPACGVDGRNLLAGVEPHACHLLAHRVEARLGDPRARNYIVDRRRAAADLPFQMRAARHVRGELVAQLPRRAEDVSCRAEVDAVQAGSPESAHPRRPCRRADRENATRAPGRRAPSADARVCPAAPPLRLAGCAGRSSRSYTVTRS